MLLIDVKRAFAGDGKKICLLTTEAPLRATVFDLDKSKKLRDWTSVNAAILLPLLTDAVVTYGENVAEALLKTFLERINDHGEENTQEKTDKDEDSRSDEDKEKEKTKTSPM